MKKTIIILNGKPRAGKDTFAAILGKHASVFKYSSVTKVKEVALRCGWNGGKTEKDRKFLSDLKMLTTEYCDMSFEDIKNAVSAFEYNTTKDYMVIDIREPEEIERAKKEFGAITVFIENDHVPMIESNIADAKVYDYEYDYAIKNNGTLEEFEENILKFLKRVGH